MATEGDVAEDGSSISVFEDLLLLVGTKGKKNFLIIFVGSLTGFVLGMNVFSYQFIGATPNHWCNISDFSASGWTPEEIRNISIPFMKNVDEEEEYSKCTQYNIGYNSFVNMTYEEASLKAKDMRKFNNQTVSCSIRYFDKESETIVTKWDLACERRHLYTWTQGGSQLGLFFGSAVIGYLMDKFGRKNVYKYCVILFVITGGISIVAPTIELFIVLRILTAFSAIGFYMSLFVLAMEICLASERSLVGSYFILPWAFGMMVTPGVAFLIREWRYLQLALSAPAALLFANFWVSPESPRWLIMNGRYDEAYKVLKDIANSNGNVIPEKEILIENMRNMRKLNDAEDTPEELSYCERVKATLKHLVILIRIKELRFQTLLVFCCWLVAAIVYYGVSLGSEQVTDNPYLYLFLGGILELVSYLALYPAVLFMGRKITLTILFIATAISILSAMSLLVTVSKNEFYVLKLLLYLVGKFAITAAFELIWFWTAELYPTKYRSLAVGESSSISRIGSVCSPFINDLLGPIGKWIPPAIFGSFAVLAAIASMMLRDTTKSNLQENVVEKSHENPAFEMDNKDHKSR